MKEYKQILDELRVQVNMLGVEVGGDYEDFDLLYAGREAVHIGFRVDINKPSMFQIRYDTGFKTGGCVKHPAVRELPLTIHNLKRVCKCMLIIATRIAKEKT